jgi:hypothetical protein
VNSIYQEFTKTKSIPHILRLIISFDLVYRSVRHWAKEWEYNDAEPQVGNACYHSVQNFLSSRLLSKKIKIRMYESTVFTVILYGCVTWSQTLGEEHRLRMFENRVLRRIFGPKRDEMTEDWSFITYTLRRV